MTPTYLPSLITTDFNLFFSEGFIAKLDRMDEWMELWNGMEWKGCLVFEQFLMERKEASIRAFWLWSDKEWYGWYE